MASEIAKDDPQDADSPIGLAADGECMRALKKLEQLVVGGLQHGHFKYTVVCEMTTGNKRRLVIEAGVSHKFVIPPDEVEKLDL